MTFQPLGNLNRRRGKASLLLHQPTLSHRSVTGMTAKRDSALSLTMLNMGQLKWLQKTSNFNPLLSSSGSDGAGLHGLSFSYNISLDKLFDMGNGCKFVGGAATKHASNRLYTHSISNGEHQQEKSSFLKSEIDPSPCKTKSKAKLHKYKFL